MADISQIKLPNNVTYDIKDAGARELIGQLDNRKSFLGVTTSNISDGSTTNPIVINGENVTAVAGNTCTKGSKEFIWNGTAWQEFGDLSSLGALAYKDSASGTFTPAGSVSRPTFEGSSLTSTGSFTPTGSVSISTSTEGTTNYTPAGSVSVTPSVSLTTTSVTPISSVGTLPSCTLPSLSMSVSDEVLTLGWSAGSFSAGTLPSTGTAVTVATGPHIIQRVFKSTFYIYKNFSLHTFSSSVFLIFLINFNFILERIIY